MGKPASTRKREPKPVAYVADQPVGGYCAANTPSPASESETNTKRETTALVSWAPTPGGGQDTAIISDEGVDLVRRLAANGVPTRAIANALGLSDPTLRKAMEERQPELKNAFDDGRVALESELVGRLLQHSRENGKASLAATIFLLKAMHGYREGEARDGGGPRVAIQINLPPALTEKAYAKIIEEKAP